MRERIEREYGVKVVTREPCKVSGHPYARVCRDIESNAVFRMAREACRIGDPVEGGAAPGKYRTYVCNPGSDRYPHHRYEGSVQTHLVSVVLHGVRVVLNVFVSFFAMFTPVFHWWMKDCAPHYNRNTGGPRGCPCPLQECKHVKAEVYLAVDALYEELDKVAPLVPMLQSTRAQLLMSVRLYPGDGGQLPYGEGTYKKYVRGGRMRTQVDVVGASGHYDDPDLWPIVMRRSLIVRYLLGSVLLNVDVVQRTSMGVILRVSRSKFRWFCWTGGMRREYDVHYTSLMPQGSHNVVFPGDYAPTHYSQGVVVTIPHVMRTHLRLKAMTMDYSQRTRNVLFKEANGWMRENPGALLGAPADVVLNAAVHDALESLNRREEVGQVAVERRLRQVGELNIDWNLATVVITQPAIHKTMLIMAGLTSFTVGSLWYHYDLTVVEAFVLLESYWEMIVMWAGTAVLHWVPLFLTMLGAVLCARGLTAALFAANIPNDHVALFWVLFVAPIVEEVLKKQHPAIWVLLPLFEWWQRDNRREPEAYVVLFLHWLWGYARLGPAILIHAAYNALALAWEPFLVAALELPQVVSRGKQSVFKIKGCCVMDGDPWPAIARIEEHFRVVGGVDGCVGEPPAGLALYGIGLLCPGKFSNLVVARACACNLMAGICRRLVPGILRARDAVEPRADIVESCLKTVRSLRNQVKDPDDLYGEFLSKYTVAERALLEQHDYHKCIPAYGSFPKLEKAAKDPTEGLGGAFKPRVIICPSWTARGFEGHYLGQLGEALRAASRRSLETLGGQQRAGWVPFPVPVMYASGHTPEDCAEFVELAANLGRRKGHDIVVYSLDASNFDGSVSAGMQDTLRRAHLALLKGRVSNSNLIAVNRYLAQRIGAPIKVEDGARAKVHLPSGVRSGSQDTSSGDSLVSLILAMDVANTCGIKLFGVMVNGDDVVLVASNTTESSMRAAYLTLGFEMTITKARLEDWCLIEFSGMRGYSCEPYYGSFGMMEWTFRPTLGRFAYKVGWSIHANLSERKSRAWARGTALSLLGGATQTGPAVGLPIADAWARRVLQLTEGTRPYYDRGERRVDVLRKSHQPFRPCSATYDDIMQVYGVDQHAVQQVEKDIRNATLGQFISERSQEVMQSMYDVDC